MKPLFIFLTVILLDHASGFSPDALAGVYVGFIAFCVAVGVVFMLVIGGVTACVIYCCHRRITREEQNDIRIQYTNREI